MAFPENDYYSLKNIRLNFKSGVKLDTMELSVKRNPIYVKRKPGSALIGANVYFGEEDPDIMIRGIQGTEFNFGLLSPNDPVETFEALSTESGTPSVFPADFESNFPAESMCVGGLGTSWNGTDLSMVEIPLIPNVLNPNS